MDSKKESKGESVQMISDSQYRRNNGVRNQWVAAMMANVSTITFGMLNQWISPNLTVLKSENSPVGEPLSPLHLSLMASLPSLIATCGSPVYSYLNDCYGRKTMMIIMSLLHASSVAAKLLSTTSSSLIVSQIILGVACCGCFTVTPMYVKEISQDSTRGALGSLVILSQNIGVLIIFTIGSLMNYYTVLWILLPLPLVHAACFLLMPESPSYLVNNGKKKEAAKALAWLRQVEEDDPIVLSELSYIQKQKELNESTTKITYCEIAKHKVYRRVFILAFIVMSFEAAAGCAIVTTFAPDIIDRSGAKVNANVEAILVPILLIIGSLMSVVLVEKWGRRPLLLFTSTCFTIGVTALGVLFTLHKYYGPQPNVLYVLSMLLCVTAFSGGMSPASYVIISEIFNFQIRARLMGPAVSVAWGMTFFHLMAYPPVADAFGAMTVFLFLSVFNMTGIVFCIFFVPETKCKKVEVIEKDIYEILTFKRTALTRVK